ncbi:MAG: hypothetical protein GY805_08985 [Chloroflexi bacterium]|nr:hypothetical protein [Chloroflexota bacterium]
MDSKSYYAAYSLLVKDYLTILEFVEPVDHNESVFSHRLYEMYLRSCTEFENICKGILIDNGYQSKGNFNINDYRTLDVQLKLSDREVGLLFWQPNTKYISPFEAWKQENTPLRWYQDYNKVKHNRDTEFARASFFNVTIAVSGVFTVLFCKFGIDFFNPFDIMSSPRNRISRSGSRTTIVNNSIFSVRWE